MITDIDLKTRKHFGINRLGEFASDTTLMFESMIRDAILDLQMIAIIAPFGSGKTHLFRRIKTMLSGGSDAVKFVTVGDLSDKPIHMGSIEDSLIYDITNEGESPRRSREARARQVRRLLGQAYANGHRICLVIEDAHRLHPETLSALKRLREIDFMGHAPLLSIVLLAWQSLDEMLERRRDILTRLHCVHLDETEGWMTLDERVAYLRMVYAHLIDEPTRQRIASLHRVPVEMNKAVAKALHEARLAGYHQVDDRTFKPSLRERYEALQRDGVSLADIAEATPGKVARQSVHDTINAGQGRHVDAVEAGIAALEARRNVQFQRVGS